MDALGKFPRERLREGESPGVIRAVVRQCPTVSTVPTVPTVPTVRIHWAGGAGAWHTRFTHHDRHHIEREMSKGVVMEHKKHEAMESARLPASFYDVSAL